MKPTRILLIFGIVLSIVAHADAARQSKADREREDRLEKAREARAKQELDHEVQSAIDDAIREVQRQLAALGITRAPVPEVLPTAPPEVKAAVAEAVKNRDAAIQYNIEQLKKYAASAARAHHSSSPRVEQETGKVQEIQDRIVTLYSTSMPAFPSFPDAPLKAGMIGKFKYPFRVSQIQGDTAMLGERFWSVPRRVMKSINGRYEKGSVYEVVRPEDHTESIWITGYPTDGLADGQSVKLEGVFHVSDTKTYTTVLGASRTVLSLTPIDLEQYIKK